MLIKYRSPFMSILITIPLLLLILPMSFSTVYVTLKNYDSFYIINFEFYQERGVFQIRSNCTVEDHLLLYNYSNPYLADFYWAPRTYVVFLELGESLNVSSVLIVYGKNIGTSCEVKIVKNNSLEVYRDILPANRRWVPKADIKVGFSLDEKFILLPLLFDLIIWLILK